MVVAVTETETDAVVETAVTANDENDDQQQK
jgi:hypothetical protein